MLKYLIVLLMPPIAFAQLDKGSGGMLSLKKEVGISFYEYPSKTYLLGTVKQQDQLTCQFPEEAILSYFCASDQEWVNSLYLESIPPKIEDRHFADIKKWNPDSNYLIVSSKVMYLVDGVRYCCIKYYIKKQGRPPRPAAHNLKELNGKWFFSPSIITNTTSVLMWLIDPIYISDIFNKRKSNSLIVNNIIDKSYIKGMLDLERLGKAFLDIPTTDIDLEGIKDSYLPKK